MKMYRLLFLAPLLSSCIFALVGTMDTLSEPIYYGDVYPPTNKVEWFMRESDVKTPHLAMGRAVFNELAGVSEERMKKHMMEHARLRGAHAVVLLDVGNLYKQDKSLTSDAISTERRQEIKLLLIRYKNF
ncbi:MAG: hypothetical protein ACOYW3_07865 [Bacteroidota bacterium]